MADVVENQIVVVKDGDREDTATVECGPFCSVEVLRSDGLPNFELTE